MKEGVRVVADYSLSGIRLNVFLGNQDKAKSELTKLIKTLENNTIKINVDFKDVKEQLNTITKAYEQSVSAQENAVSRSQSTIKKMYRSSNAEIKAMVEEQRKLLESQYGNKGKVNYTYATDSFGNSNITSAFIEIKNKAQETEKVMFGLQESIKSVGNEVQKIYTFNATGKKEIINLSQADKDLNKFNNTVSNTRKKYENEINKLINKNKELAYDKGIIEFKNRLKNLDNFEFDGLEQELKELQLQFNKLKIGFQETGALSQTSDNLFKRVGQYFTATSIYYEMSNAIRYAIENIRSLDTSLVELSKVSSITRDEFSSFVNEANKIGNELGKTSKDVIDAVTNFQRAGYALEDSKELAKSALTMVNISENMKDAGDNASALVNILKGYKMEVSEVSKINDIYNNISNNMAVNFDTLVSGTREIAGLMNIYGNSLENTASMITSITEIMGSSGEETANALKTISMRLAGFNDQGEKDVQLVAKLNDEFQKIANMSLTDVNGQLKSTFEIVDEYSKKVKELNLSNEVQSYLGELVAGKHRASYWTAMVQNFDSARKAMEYANDSLNSSIEEQEAYIRSLDGQIEILKSSLMSLSYNSVNTDWVINIVKGTNEIVKLIDKIGLANIAMATFVGYLSAKGKMGIFNSVINSIVSSITSYTTSVTGATATTMAFGTAMKALTGIGIFAGVMAGVAIFDQLNVTIEEQKQKVEELQQGYESLNSKIESLKSIENPTSSNERQIALLERELALQEKLLEIETEKLTKKQFQSNYGTIQSDLEALQTSLEKYEETQNRILQSGGDASQFATLKTREADLLKYTDKANETLTSLMDVYDDLTPKQKEQADVMIKQAEAVLKLADDILGLNVNTNNQTDANNELVNSIDRLSVEALTNEVSSLSEAYDDNVEKIELLNKAVNSLADGQTLTSDTILDLLDAFPSLRGEITETNGVYSISKEALLELKNQAVDTFGVMVNDQRTATSEAIANAKTRISAYQKELEQLKKLAQGQSLLYGLQNKNKIAMGHGDLSSDTKNYKLISEKENQIKKEQADIQKYLDLLNQINIAEQDFEIATSTGNTKKGSNISNKNSKSKKEKSNSDLINKLKKQFEADKTAILKYGEDIEKEIERINQKMEMAELKGDTKLVESLNIELETLYSTRPNATKKMADELRTLKNKAIQQVNNAALKSDEKLELIADLTADFDEDIAEQSTNWWKYSNELIEHQIKLLELKKEIASKPLDNMQLEISSHENKIKLLELENGTMAEQVNIYNKLLDSEEKRENYLRLTIDDFTKQRDLLDSTSQQYKTLTEYILDFENQLTDSLQAQANAREKLIDMMYDEMELALEKSIYGDDGKDAWEKANNKRIENLNEELDLLKKQSDEKKKQQESEERLLEIKKLEEQLENAKKQKTVQEFKKQSDGSWQWEYTYDAEKVSELESQLAQKRKEEDQRIEEEKQARKEQSLRDEISRLQKEQRAKEQFYNESKEDLLQYLNDNKESLIVNGEEVLKIVTTNMDNINTEFDTKMELITNSLQEKLAQIKAMFQDALSMNNAIGSMGGGGSSGDGKPVYSNKGGSGKTYFQYGDGSVEVLRPDGTSSTVKPGDKNYSSTISAMEKDHVKKRYKKGGIVNDTGLMYLDGTDLEPEWVLNAEQTKAFVGSMDSMPEFNENMKEIKELSNIAETRYDFSYARDLSKMQSDIGLNRNRSIGDSITNNNATQIHIDKIELPNVKEGREFVKELDSYMNNLFSGLPQKAKLIPSGEF